MIAAYPGYNYIMAPAELGHLWPEALASRIRNGAAHIIHIPFRKEPLADAISQFGPDHYPVGSGLTFYSRKGTSRGAICNVRISNLRKQRCGRQARCLVLYASRVRASARRRAAVADL